MFTLFEKKSRRQQPAASNNTYWLLTWYLMMFAFFAKNTAAEESNTTFNVCWDQLATFSFTIQPSFENPVVVDNEALLACFQANIHASWLQFSNGICTDTAPYYNHDFGNQIICTDSYNFKSYNISVSFSQSLSFNKDRPFSDFATIDNISQCYINSFNNTGFTCKYSPSEKALIISAGPLALFICVGAIITCKLKSVCNERKKEQADDEQNKLISILDAPDVTPKYGAIYKV